MRKLVLVGVVGMVAGVVAWGGFNTAMEATNTMGFCISCHEMENTVYQEYRTSPHFQNPSGVRATCPDCHVPRDWTHKLVRKVQATKELYHWAVGSIDTPEKFEDKRHALAVREWERMRASDSRECRNCHSFDAMDFHKQSTKAARAMREAAEKGKTCIDCHKAVAHKMPDVTRGHRAVFAALSAEAAGLRPAAGDTLATLAPKALLAGPGGAVEGEVAAGATLRVLAVEGDHARVELTGWRREGFESLLYARQGKRMALASLEAPAVARLEALRAVEDADSGQTWTEMRLQAWVAVGGFLRDPQRLWDYAARMYQDNCTLCHALHPPQAHKANDWIGHLNSMKRLTPLSAEEADMLLIYLQGRAKDAAG